MLRRQLLLLAALLVVPAAIHAAPPPSRPLGDSRLFTELPQQPGFPEGIAVEDGIVYVTGPAQFGSFVQPAVLAYDLETGAKVREYPIAGQNPNAPQALAGIAFDKHGRLYALDIQLGIVRINVDTGAQEIYAPTLPIISPQGPLPNEMIFDKKGNAYISDSFQGTIWRVPAGGGQPQVWFQDPHLAVPFGANGMRIDHTGKNLYFSVSIAPPLVFDPDLPLPLGDGYIYRLPLVNQPQPADLTVFHHYGLGTIPDGIAFGKSKKLYVTLAGSNQISVLRPDGTEEVRYGGPIQNPNGPALPYANPAAIAFSDKARSLLVTNHAIFAPAPQPFAIFDVFVNDRSEPLEKPRIP